MISTFILLNSELVYAQEQDSIVSPKKVELDEINIIGQATPSVYSQLARKVSIISWEEINASSATTIQDLLEYAASVDIRQRNIHGVQADIHLRGGTFDQVMILLNGINISDPQTGHFNLDIPLELSALERIEILHGSGARIYGANAHKGVINIITRKKINQVSGNISFGQNKLFHSNVTANLSKENYFQGLSFSNNTCEGFTDNTDYKLNHLYYQGGVNFKPVNISWQAGLNFKTFGANDFYSPLFPEQFEETGAGFGSLGITTNGKIKLNIQGYWRRHNDHFLLKRQDPSFYENYHLTDIAGIKISANFTSAIGKTFMGVENRNESILSTVLGENLNSPVRIKETDSAYYTKYYSRNTLNYFLEQNYNINKLSVTAGFLFTWNTDYQKKTDIFPGVDLSYRLLDEKVKLFASVNRSLRLPTFTDMFYKDPSNEGNSLLNPEELFAIETGLEYTIPKISANLTFFRDQGKNAIDWIWLNDRALYKAMNIAEVTTRGIEITCKYQPANNNKRSFRANNASVSYTFIDLEKTTGTYDSKYSLDYLKHKFLFNYVQEISKKVNLICQLSYVSRNGSYIDYDNIKMIRFNSPFEPYLLVDSKLSWSNPNFVLFAEVSNLFNTKYTDVGNLIQPSRWITGGIRINLSFEDE